MVINSCSAAVLRYNSSSLFTFLSEEAGAKNKLSFFESLLSFDIFGKTATCLYEYTKVESDMPWSSDMLIDWEIYGSNIR